MTLTLIPAAIVSSIAGMPSSVAGILIITLGRSTRSCSERAAAIVSVGVVGERGRDLDRDEAVAAVVRVVHRAQHVGGGDDVVEHDVPVGVLDRQALPRARRQLLVVALAGADRLVEDGRVRRDAADAVVRDQLRQPTAGEQRAGEVVVPRALPEVVEAGDGAGLIRSHQSPFSSSARARAATFSGVKPNSASTVAPGADAPKWSMPDRRRRRSAPSRRSRRPRPRASGTSAGSTCSRYSSGCAAKRSHDGIDTTRTDSPSSRSTRRDAQRHLGPGADEHEVETVAFLVDEDVGAAGTPSGARSAVVASTGTLLAGEDQGGRAVAVDVDPPRLAHLVGIGGTDQPEAGHRPQRRQLLDRLVGRAVLAEADRVVGPHEQRSCSRESAARRTAPRM